MSTLPTSIAFVLSSAVAVHGAAHASAHTDVVRIGDWTLRAHVERFTGRMICRLSKPDVEYQRQALVFHLPPRIDASTAVYRIDGGPPFWVQNDALELARLGFTLVDDDLENPSGGLVRIPERRLMNTRTISIETAADHRPYTFKIDHFAGVLEAAAKAGCGAANFNDN